MWKLLRFVKGKAKVMAIFAIIWIFLQTVFATLQPVVLMKIVDLVGKWDGDGTTPVPLEPSQVAEFWLFNGLMLAACVFCLLFGMLGSYFGSKSALLTTQNIRQAFFAKIQTLSFGDIDHITTSSLITRMTNDVLKFQRAFQMILTMLLQAPIMLIGGMVILFTTNPAVGGVSVGLVVVLGIVIGINAWKVIPYFDKAQTAIDNSNKVMRENILGMRVVKTFNLQQNQQDRFDVANEELRNFNTKSQVWMSLLIPSISLVMQVTIGVVMLVGGIQLQNSNSDKILKDLVDIGGNIFGDVQVLWLLMSAVIISIMVVINIFRCKPSTDRINAVFATVPSIQNCDNPQAMPNNLDIVFKDVSFKYNTKASENVLSKINCQFKQGSFVGIVGGTGAGKSSLVSLISRLYDCQKGSVTIGGVDVKKLDLDQVRDDVGVVLQENILFSGTIASNLRYGDKQANNQKMDWASKIACAYDFINKTPKKYESIVEQRGRNFSGGQRQRLTIARAVIKQPKILILDDATSALDLATEAKLQSNLRTKLKDTTVIIVAQRISSVKDCDQILVLDKGKIVGSGSHEQLRKNNAIYRSIIVSQMGKEGLTR